MILSYFIAAACESGHEAFVQLLLENGADVHSDWFGLSNNALENSMEIYPIGKR
jgi:ankyrin repeat protein